VMFLEGWPPIVHGRLLHQVTQSGSCPHGWGNLTLLFRYLYLIQVVVVPSASRVLIAIRSSLSPSSRFDHEMFNSVRGCVIQAQKLQLFAIAMATEASLFEWIVL
jgi:hypothetical protein